jgi:hypothetical protein
VGSHPCAERFVQRIAVQLPQARHTNCQKANDLAREAVGCMGVFGTLVSRSEEPPACGADGQTIASENRVSAQRLAHQPPQAHRENCQKANDLAREAVGCMGVFGALVSRSE